MKSVSLLLTLVDHFLFLFFCFLVHKTDKHSELQNGLF